MSRVLVLLCTVVVACGGSSSGSVDGGGKPVDAGRLDDGGRIIPPATCVAPADRSNVFYVTEGGSDGADGSANSPWATIEHAVDNVGDDSTILVGPGTYTGRIRLDAQFATGITIRSEPAYQARLRNNGTVITIFEGQGITLNGFDIAHTGSGAEALIIQIQDLIGEPGGAEAVSRITLRNNILHDSYNNDILKINNGAKQITIERNIFYNQQGSDEHIDINSVAEVTIQDNLFFNDFAASGRSNNNDTSSFIVIKDSNGNDDQYLGSQNIQIRRNAFFNWESGAGANFILIGEDGNSYHEAFDIMIENNLLLGNLANEVRAPFGIKGGRDITFRHNTVVGDMPGAAFAFRFNQEGANPTNDNIDLYNNIWSDPTGSMGDFSDTPTGETTTFNLDNNLYWNGGQAIPSEGADLINVGDDDARVEQDPRLPAITNLTAPTWNESTKQFADGSGDICAAFDSLVTRFATPGATSPAIDSARTDQSPQTDILGNTRSGATSIGALEPQ